MKSTQQIFFEPLLWSFWAEIEPHFILTLKEQPTRPYALIYFAKLCLDFSELTGYSPVPGTLNYLFMALLPSQIDTAKLFERSLSSFWGEI